jgi:polyisoprenyl-teichoic acid--peptidoglycan teichoic acid transferase
VARWGRRLAIIAAAIVLLGTATVVGLKLFVARVDSAIPRANLFGEASPSASPTLSPTPSATPPAGADIVGPLNFLIVGVDTRVTKPGWVPHADAVMIMHVSADLSHAYLTSLPRDLVVPIPAFAPSHYGGGRSKLTHAMTFGARVPGTSKPNPAQGFQLLAQTVSNYTGIVRFDAGAILTFNGLRNVVDALGGIDFYVDQRIVSIHMAPNGRYRPVCSSCAHGYGGPQATYEVGTHHLAGWQALDIARQRYLSGGDYTRQRHQRQIIRAIMAQVFRQQTYLNPIALNGLVTALGTALVFDGRGRGIVEFAYALRHLNGDTVTLVGLPGAGVYGSSGYLGERLDSVASSYFAAVRQDQVQAFVDGHPSLVNREP